jgi:hypothetical protein
VKRFDNFAVRYTPYASALYVALPGSFADSGTVGGNTLRFRGRLNGKPLKPGRYRLLATPTDSAGNVGRVARTAFRIIL